jgi:hypothetical protein
MSVGLEVKSRSLSIEEREAFAKFLAQQTT